MIYKNVNKLSRKTLNIVFVEFKRKPWKTVMTSIRQNKRQGVRVKGHLNVQKQDEETIQVHVAHLSSFE